MRIAGLGPFLACAISAISCGGGSGGGASSCLYTFTTGAGDQPPAIAGSCREWRGASDQVAARQQDCASAAEMDGGITLSATFAQSPCPTMNIVGGCRDTASGVTFTDWYYGPDQPTVDQVMYACAQEGAKFVPAP